MVSAKILDSSEQKSEFFISTSFVKSGTENDATAQGIHETGIIDVNDELDALVTEHTEEEQVVQQVDKPETANEVLNSMKSDLMDVSVDSPDASYVQNSSSATNSSGVSSPITPETDHIDIDFHNLECVTQQKRVKVYLLENNEWKDVGTGYCTGEKISEQLISTVEKNSPVSTHTNSDAEHNLQLERNEQALKDASSDDEETLGQFEAFLVVRDEKSSDNILLISKLEGNIEYQRQEDTLIVWKDLNGKDIALSFEESSGCDHVCEFIVYVQIYMVKTISLVAIKSDVLTNTTIHEIIAGPVNLPLIKPDLSIVEMIEALKIFNENLTYQFLKMETLNFIIEHNYFDCLIINFSKSESEQSWKKLLLLSSILKTIILFNEQIILDYMLKEENFNSILGILEYDSEYPTMKANYRDTFHEINSQQMMKNQLWFENRDETNTSCNTTINKPTDNTKLTEEHDCQLVINQLCKLTFLRDVVLVRYLEDYPIIADCIQEDQTFIIDFITNKSTILDQIIDTFLNSTDKNKKLNSLKLIHECVLMAKTSLVNHGEKAEFFVKLIKAGLFKMLKDAFNTLGTNNAIDENIKMMATDLIVIIIEHDVLLVNSKTSVASVAAAAAAAASSSSSSEVPDLSVVKDFLLPPTKSVSTGFPTKSPTEAHIVNESLHDMSLLLIISKLLVYGNNLCLKDQLLQTMLTLLHQEGNTGADDFMTSSYFHFDIQTNKKLNGNGTPMNVNDIYDVEVSADEEAYIVGSDKNGEEQVNVALKDPVAGDGDEDVDVEEEEKEEEEDFDDDDEMFIDEEYDFVSKKEDKASEILGVNIFLNEFYDTIAPTLFEPLVKDLSIDYTTLIYLVKLVEFIAVIHNRKVSRDFILNNDILPNVSKLITDPRSSLQLKLTCIRCLKSVISLNDEKYTAYCCSNNLLLNVFELLKENEYRDNLCTSTVLDMIKNIMLLKQDSTNVKSVRNFNLLKDHIFDNFELNLIDFNNVQLIKRFLSLKNTQSSRENLKTDPKNSIVKVKRQREDTPEMNETSSTNGINNYDDFYNTDVSQLNKFVSSE